MTIKDRKARVREIVIKVIAISLCCLCVFGWAYLSSIGNRFAQPVGYIALLILIIFFN
jgi:hypothetical protein